MTDATTTPASVRRVELHRRVAVIRPDTIEVRPSRRALVGPLAAFLAGVAAFAGIALGLHSLPVGVLVLLLLIAVTTIPLAGVGVVYSLIGADVVIDRRKQSATWQQGMIGLGIGTEELVPFAKITAILVEEAGAAPEGSGSPTEEFAQWQIVLEKTSGRRLVIGGVTAARPLATEALARAADVAGAIAALTGAPLRLPPRAEPEVERPVRQRRRAPRRRNRRAVRRH
jgi:hypothetical protein